MDMPTGKRARIDDIVMDGTVDTTPISTAEQQLDSDDPQLYECDSQGENRDDVVSPDAGDVEEDPLHLHFLLVSSKALQNVLATEPVPKPVRCIKCRHMLAALHKHICLQNVVGNGNLDAPIVL